MILPAALALAALWPGAVVAQQVRSVVTTADLAHPLAPGPANRFQAGRLPAGPAIKVDDRRRFQRIEHSGLWVISFGGGHSFGISIGLLCQHIDAVPH